MTGEEEASGPGLGLAVMVGDQGLRIFVMSSINILGDQPS